MSVAGLNFQAVVVGLATFHANLTFGNFNLSDSQTLFANDFNNQSAGRL